MPQEELTVERLADGNEKKGKEAANYEQDAAVPPDVPLTMNVAPPQDQSTTERGTSQNSSSSFYYVLWLFLLFAHCVVLSIVVFVGLGLVFWYTNWLKFTSHKS